MNFSKISQLKDIHIGQRALLLCNGPSLRQIESSVINKSDYILFGLNKIHLATDLGIRLPDYTVAVNKKVINQLNRDKSFSYNKLILSHRAGAVFPESDDIYYVNTGPQNLERFSLDCSVGIHEGWTVTHAALQVIHYMGIRNVAIVGMDHNFDTDPLLANKSEVRVGDDHNHFSKNYFADGQEWDLPDLVNSEISYHAARRVFESSGGVVIDATTNGKCRVFLRAASLSEAFKILDR